MGVRETSLEAYRDIIQSGLISEKRLDVFKAVIVYGPGTSAEIIQAANIDGNSIVSQARARLNELREMGVIEEAGERKCKQTNRKAIVWRVTGNYPTKYEIPETKKERKEKALNMILTLSKRMPKSHIEELRAIYRKVKEI